MDKRSCGLCGTRFLNVFEAVEHARRPGNEESFNPKFILGEGRKLGLGELLKKIYNGTNSERVSDGVEEAFALMYIAEMRPTWFPTIYDQFVMNRAMPGSDVTKFVYKIVTEEAFKEVGLRP